MAQEHVGARSALTVGLAVKPWIEESVLRQAIMTPEQEQIANRDVCPKCGGKLERLSAAEDMSFNGCEQCHDVWVLTPNDFRSAEALCFQRERIG